LIFNLDLGWKTSCKCFIKSSSNFQFYK